MGFQHSNPSGQAVDLLGNKDGFPHPRLCRHQARPIAILPVGSKSSVFSGIMGDHCESGIQDLGRGTVILCKPYHIRTRMFLDKPVKATGIRSTESIDGLIRVTDHEQLAALFIPCLKQAVLQRIDVLELVHQKIGKMLLPPRRSLWFFYQLQCLQQKVIKIKKPPFFQIFLIGEECVRVLLRHFSFCLPARHPV